MLEKYQKINEEILVKILEEAVYSVEGIGSLVNAPFAFNLKAKDKEITKGILLVQNEDSISFDIFINVLFGSKIPQIAFSVQENVKNTFEDNFQMKLDRINIHVQGIENEKI